MLNLVFGNKLGQMTEEEPFGDNDLNATGFKIVLNSKKALVPSL